MLVRPVQVADAGVWSRFRSRLWPEFSADHLANEVRSFFKEGSIAPVAAAFVALDSDVPVGFLELSVRPFADGCDSAPVPHVEGWYVEPVARGRGAGRALMESAERWARDRGFVELASDTEVHNEGSRTAHARCGFVETERLIKFRKKLR